MSQFQMRKRAKNLDREGNSWLRGIRTAMTNFILLLVIVPLVILALICLWVVASAGELYLKARSRREERAAQRAQADSLISNSGERSHEAS